MRVTVIKLDDYHCVIMMMMHFVCAARNHNQLQLYSEDVCHREYFFFSSSVEGGAESATDSSEPSSVLCPQPTTTKKGRRMWKSVYFIPRFQASRMKKGCMREKRMERESTRAAWEERGVRIYSLGDYWVKAEKKMKEGNEKSSPSHQTQILTLLRKRVEAQTMIAQNSHPSFSLISKLLKNSEGFDVRIEKIDSGNDNDCRRTRDTHFIHRNEREKSSLCICLEVSNNSQKNRLSFSCSSLDFCSCLPLSSCTLYYLKIRDDENS